MPISQNINRRLKVTLTTVRIGHSSSTHAFLMGKNPTPVCHTYREDTFEGLSF